MPHEGVEPSKGRGPVRTLKIGDRITVYGDLEVVSVEARHVTVRVVRPSAPVMFPVKSEHPLTEACQET